MNLFKHPSLEGLNFKYLLSVLGSSARFLGTFRQSSFSSSSVLGLRGSGPRSGSSPMQSFINFLTLAKRLLIASKKDRFLLGVNGALRCTQALVLKARSCFWLLCNKEAIPQKACLQLIEGSVIYRHTF